MTHAKIQHYVPKFLLKNFGLGKKDQLWVYDKLTGRTFHSNVKNVASEAKFYDFEIDDRTYSLESSLSKLESKAKKLIEQIISSDSVAELTESDRSTVASFLAIQYVRTKAFRAQWAELPSLFRTKIESMKTEPAGSLHASGIMQDPTESQVKKDSAFIMMRAPEDFGPHFLSKSWFLAKTTNSHPFIIGDNPVSLQNHIDMAPYGSLGLAVKGIEIYLPLSATRALAMWCPSLALKIYEAAETIRSLPKSKLVTLNNPEGILEMDSALRRQSTLLYSPTHVINFNSLQVARSERYLFSSKNDFSLPLRMIHDFPNMKYGPRMSVG